MKDSLKVIFRSENLPLLQNRLYNTEEEAKGCPVGDVILVVDSVTSIVSNQSFESAKVIYDADYNNEQGASSAFRDHLDYVAELIERNFDQEDVIEVGCGKGAFVGYLRQKGFNVTGLDPTYEGNDSAIQKRLFEKGLGLRASGIVLRHVLEHVENPVDFLRSIAEANGGTGKIYIEVPCFDWIAKNQEWVDIFYEHVNYFRMDDFKRIFKSVHHIERTFGGQYLSVIADLDSIRDFNDSEVIAEEIPVLDIGSAQLAQLILDWKNSSGGEVAVWGAGSKGVIFTLHMLRANVEIDYVVDINPDKIGKFLPCSGLQVISPDAFIELADPGTRICVMNPNYLKEIREFGGDAYEYQCV